MCSLLMFVVWVLFFVVLFHVFGLWYPSFDGRMITVPFSAIFVIRIADLGFQSNFYLNFLIIIFPCLLLSSVAALILCVCFLLEKLRSIQFSHNFYVFSATVDNLTLSSFIDINAEWPICVETRCLDIEDKCNDSVYLLEKLFKGSHSSDRHRDEL